MTTIGDKWFYAIKGERKGPISIEEVRKAITDGLINDDTLVWSGQGDWIEAKNTQLSDLFHPKEDIPPPLPEKIVNNKFVWSMVLIPPIGATVEGFIGIPIPWQFIMLLYFAMYLLDEIQLKAAGYDAPSVWGIIFFPLYLWKRAVLLKQKQIHLTAWIVAPEFNREVHHLV